MTEDKEMRIDGFTRLIYDETTKKIILKQVCDDWTLPNIAFHKMKEFINKIEATLNMSKIMSRINPTTDQLENIATNQVLKNGMWGWKFEDGSEGKYFHNQFEVIE